MERIFKSVAIGVALALAVTWCVPDHSLAQSAPQSVGVTAKTGTIVVASGGQWGSSSATPAYNGRFSNNALRSQEVAVPFGKKFSVYIGCSNGAAADADSVCVTVETKYPGLTSSLPNGRNWLLLDTAASNGDSTDYPMVFNFDPDMDSTQGVTMVVPGRSYRRGTSLGVVRISMNGPAADSLADGVGRWPWAITWEQ